MLDKILVIVCQDCDLGPSALFAVLLHRIVTRGLMRLRIGLPFIDVGSRQLDRPCELRTHMVGGTKTPGWSDVTCGGHPDLDGSEAY